MCDVNHTVVWGVVHVYNGTLFVLIPAGRKIKAHLSTGSPLFTVRLQLALICNASLALRILAAVANLWYSK
ncbi:MAG: hypothetical protein HXX17_08005 [Geobacteraceae bacterium]|nr:hypothetical protein [Geobacteraceae bacterium]